MCLVGVCERAVGSCSKLRFHTNPPPELLIIDPTPAFPPFLACARPNDQVQYMHVCIVRMEASLG